MRAVRNTMAACLMMLMAGCGALGLSAPQPSNAQESFSLAYSTLELAYDSISVAMDNPTSPLSVSKARDLKDSVDASKEALDVAYAAFTLGQDYDGDVIGRSQTVLQSVRAAIAAAEGGG